MESWMHLRADSESDHGVFISDGTLLLLLLLIKPVSAGLGRRCLFSAASSGGTVSCVIHHLLAGRPRGCT